MYFILRICVILLMASLLKSVNGSSSTPECKEVNPLLNQQTKVNKTIQHIEHDLQQQSASNDAKFRELQNKIHGQEVTAIELQRQCTSCDEQIALFKAEHNAIVEEMASQNTQIALNAAKIKSLESQFSILQSGSSCLGKSTDVHMLNLPNIGTFSAPCDSKLVDFGWTVIQRRVDGSVSFNRNWKEYKDGFGDLRGEFFLGLEKLHVLTQFAPHELYIHLEDFDNDKRYARYSHFIIGNEAESYELKLLGEYSGTAGDSLSYHKNLKFATKDRNDFRGCAKSWLSGWWFDYCFQCNLNTLYTRNSGPGVYRLCWNDWHNKPIKFAQMMIRPIFN